MTTNNFPQQPAEQPTKGKAKTKTRRRWVIPTLGAGAALLVGVAIGNAGDSSPETTAAPEPQPTVTVTPEPEVKTETIEVETTPQSCLDALDAAEGLAGNAGSLAGYVSILADLVPRAYDAGLYGDIAEAQAIVSEGEALNADMDRVLPDLQANVDAYNAASAECRAMTQ